MGVFNVAVLPVRSDETCSPKERNMDNTTLLIIILVLIFIFGGGYYGRGRWF